ncbi:MAG TPA: CHRD domain-containing protein [Gaiellaceae bacterium]|nr:CHRD domain-containing protein [Gaiellaceae bacterium]
MSTRALIPALALAGALVVTVGASARPQATTIQLGTVLDAAQEVPSPTGAVSSAGGTFSATVTKSDTGASVTWQLSFTGLTANAIAAHIHTGAAGSPGPVVLALCGPCSSPASGTGALTQAALDAIQAGTAYVNVHTPTNPAGEIRGQLATTASISTALSSRQEVPKPKGNVKRATGTFTTMLAKLGTTGTVTWRLRFSRLTGRAIAAHIHVARVGRAGPVAVALCGPCRNGQRGTANLTAATLAALQAGRGYVNVHTPKNPGGEIRGQIRSVPLTIS